jgi:hypothetical protein
MTARIFKLEIRENPESEMAAKRTKELEPLQTLKVLSSEMDLAEIRLIR